jgi:hypothetical protein
MTKWIVSAAAVAGIIIFLRTDQGKVARTQLRKKSGDWSSQLLHFTENLQENLENLQSGLQTFQRTLRDTLAS